MGLQASSGLVLLFAFLAYILPILGGWYDATFTPRLVRLIVDIAQY